MMYQEALLRSIRTATHAVVALTAALALASCTGGSGTDADDNPDETVDDGGSASLVLGSTVVPQSFDPAGVGDANYVPYAQAAYDSLIYRTPDGAYEPMLATEWSFSDDNLVLSMTLRDDVTFSDGAVLDAAAVKANLEHFQQGGGPLAGQLGSLEDVVVVDDTHVEIHLSSPIPDLVYNLSDAAGRMASPDALESPDLQTVPVGTGPYVMDADRTVQGSSYVFTAREDYWNPDLQKFDSVEFKIFTDEVALLNALKSGQVMAGNLSSQDNIAEAEAAGIEILNPEYHISWAGLIMFDRTGAIVPQMADVRVRQAMAHAIDTQAILDAIFLGNGKLTNQIFNEASPAYDEALDGEFSYDPDRAKELLAEAGYADGFAITMPAVSGFMTPALQEAIKTQYGEVGITVNFETVEISSFINDLLSGKYAVSYMFLGSVPTDWFVVQSYLTESSAWNPLHATAPDLQELIDSIPSASDEEREQAFAEINQFVVENVWFDPWLWVEENYAVVGDVDVELQNGQNIPSIYNYSPID
jgi:peptide/nickel transport system substrate-binding protein